MLKKGISREEPSYLPALLEERPNTPKQYSRHIKEVIDELKGVMQDALPK